MYWVQIIALLIVGGLVVTFIIYCIRALIQIVNFDATLPPEEKEQQPPSQQKSPGGDPSPLRS